MIVGVFQEGIVHLDDLVQREAIDAQNEIHVDLAVGCALEGNLCIDSSDSLFHFNQHILLDEIALVQQNPICKSDLLHSFVLDSLWLLVLKVLDNMFCINK